MGENEVFDQIVSQEIRLDLRLGSKNYEVAKLVPEPNCEIDPRNVYVFEKAQIGKVISTLNDGEVNQGYLYIFDEKHAFIGRISDRGTIEIACDVPIQNIDVKLWYEGKEEHHQVAQSYSEQLKTNDPPFINLQGPLLPGDNFHLIHGHHRYEAAKIRNKPTVRSWIMLMNSPMNPLIIEPKFLSNLSTGQN